MRKLFSENIEVHEHESWSKFKSGEKIVRDDLGLEDVAILDELKKKYKIKYSFNKDHELEIESNEYVGSVKLENINLTVNIVPKIFKDKTDAPWSDLSILLASANTWI